MAPIADCAAREPDNKTDSDDEDFRAYEGPDPFPRWGRRAPAPYTDDTRIGITALGRLALDTGDDDARAGLGALGDLAHEVSATMLRQIVAPFFGGLDDAAGRDDLPPAPPTRHRCAGFDAWPGLPGGGSRWQTQILVATDYAHLDDDDGPDRVDGDVVDHMLGRDGDKADPYADLPDDDTPIEPPPPLVVCRRCGAETYARWVTACHLCGEPVGGAP